ncbi:MAG: outer membrane beta-barrel domain-containing protein [Bdellovibrionaceae bacterium]|nr:outer membrane beta-barrel domain-containing protein [Pseudobdellovibrionaceae bacterium]
MNLKWILLMTLIVAPRVGAQEDPRLSENQELEQIESELSKSKIKPTRQRSALRPETAEEPRLSELKELSPYSEVAVLQRKFLPKTGRFQFFAGISLATNEAFFNTGGFVAKGGWFFTEGLGLEVSWATLGTSPAQATRELRDIHGVSTEGLSRSKGYTVFDLVWVPIYGKMTWFNRKIVPFDLYFSGGYGSTSTNNGGAGTLHLSSGQIFAISKSMAFRWDFSWNFFTTKGINNNTSNFNNLFLSAGLSFFIPEARYR